ncbi:MAG: HAMP domain-containing sensor histidine kinase [Elusimicrobiota bacterium]
MRIKTKFSIFAVLLIVVCVIAVSYSIFLIEKKLLVENQNQELTKTISQFSAVAREAIIAKDDLLALNYLKALKKTALGFENGYLINKLGTIIATTNADLLRKKKLPDKKDNSIRISNDVISGNKKIGFVCIDFSAEVLKKLTDENIKKIGFQVLLTSLLVLVFGIIISVMFAAKLSKPVKKLVTEVRAIADGNLETKADVLTKDEIGDLANEFNKMAVSLKYLDHLKSDFISNVSHELRSPLAAIESYINLMLEDKEELNYENLAKIKNNTARLSKFIDDLLDVSKIEQKGGEISEKKVVKLNTVVEDVVSLFKVQTEDKNLKLENKLPEKLPDVIANSERLKQVFINLISNAIKFTQEGGKIQIEARGKRQEASKGKEVDSTGILHLASCIEVAVADTGIGIPSDQLAKIFDKFHQVKGTVDELKGPKGTGLGLSIVKGIIEEHNGKVWVESELNKGTTFYFTLPVNPNNGTE